MNLKNKKGAVLVETAIILPLLLVIVFGIIEFGWAMYITNSLNNAAREGARLAAVTPKPITADDARVDARVKSSLLFNYNKQDLTIVTIPPLASGDPVTVTVTLIFRELTPIIPLLDLINPKREAWTFKGKTLKGEATMRYEL